MSKIVLILLTIVFTLPASSHEPEYSQRTDIIHILDAYSEKTGVKFVADPRVKAQVNMIGLKVEDIEKVDLVEILLLHAFVAYEKMLWCMLFLRSSKRSLEQSWEANGKAIGQVKKHITGTIRTPSMCNFPR